MTCKWSLLVVVFVIATLCGMSALAQDKPSSLDEPLKRIESGLADAGARAVWNTSDGRIDTARRYQLISTDGCTMQIQMEVEASQGGRTTFSKFINSIPLSELDLSEIKLRTGDSGSPDPVFITSLNSSGGSGRGSFNLKLPIIGGRKVISYLVENRYDWTSNTRKSQGQQSFFSISFKDKKAAEQVALAFVQASRLCGAKEKAER